MRACTWCEIKITTYKFTIEICLNTTCVQYLEMPKRINLIFYQISLARRGASRRSLSLVCFAHVQTNVRTHGKSAGKLHDDDCVSSRPADIKNDALAMPPSSSPKIHYGCCIRCCCICGLDSDGVPQWWWALDEISGNWNVEVFTRAHITASAPWRHKITHVFIITFVDFLLVFLLCENYFCVRALVKTVCKMWIICLWLDKKPTRKRRVS